MKSLVCRVSSILAGMAAKAATSFSKRALVRERRTRAMLRAIRARTVTCAVKAFVEATPISGPAWV